MEDFFQYLLDKVKVLLPHQAKGKADIVRRVLKRCGVTNDLLLFFDAESRTLRIKYMQDLTMI